jgi:hypothetical protein
MENTFDIQPVWLKNLRVLARIISIIFIIIYSLLITVMGLMFNRPAPASDYIALASCSIYVIGLLICFKWERLGGLISSGFLVIALIYMIYYDTGSNYDGTFNVGIYIGIFILAIPCILHFISWYFHRRLEINHPKTEKRPNDT